MSNSPLVSVIIPVYNDSEYVGYAIDSVLNQTYKNIEIIVINDGSNDDGKTLSALTKYQENCSIITVENGGVSKARNCGVKISNGEYIAFLDSDDYFSSDKIQKQLDLMISNNYSISNTSYNKLNLENGEILFKSTSEFSGEIYPQIIHYCNIATPTIMIKRILFKEFEFKEDIHIGEDVCLWIDIAYKYEFGHIDEPLSTVRVSDDSAAYNPKQQAIGIANILQYVILNNKYSKEIFYIKKLIETLNNTLDDFSKSEGIKVSKQIVLAKMYYSKFMSKIFGFTTFVFNRVGLEVDRNGIRKIKGVKK